MKRNTLFFIVLFILAGCNGYRENYYFKVDGISIYPVGKHTVRYSYKYPYLSLITREVYKNKKIKVYNFSHVLTIVKLPKFDTIFSLKKINLEWFLIWKVKFDTIFGFMGDGVPEKGPVWEYYKNIKLVKILPSKGIVYDTLLFVANGKMGGIKHMKILENGETEYLMFDYDFHAHLIELPSLKYLGYTREWSLYLEPLYFSKDNLFVSIVGARLPGHGNDLYIGKINIKNMKVEKLMPVFLDSIRNVYGVVGFSDKNNFVFTAGDGTFAHHIYAYYKKRYRLVFSFYENTIPFITGTRIGKCNVFVASLGHPSSFYTYKVFLGVVKEDSLISLNEIKLQDKADFIYPPLLEKDGKNGALLFSVYNKDQQTDNLYIIKGSCFRK